MKRKRKKKYVCDCSSGNPHGAEDCTYYVRLAESIRDALKEQQYDRDRNAEDERWERLKL